MDRNREGRRASVAVSNGLARRRHRSGSLRDSPDVVDEDGLVDVQEAVRIRDRKKHRDRDNRDRSSVIMNKRRRGVDVGDESTEESVNDDEDEDEDDRVRMLPPTPVTAMYSPSSVAVSVSNHHQQLNQHRKNFPPSAAATTKIFKPVQPWLATDEKICVSVPRKARSASVKRSHECWASSGGGGSGGSGVAGESIPRQASTSPVRVSLVSASPVSPSSSSISARKKMKSNGHKHQPPLKSSSKSSSSNQDEIEMEIEIAEVLYGMKRQPQGPLKQEIMATNNESMQANLREVGKTTSGDAKSRVSSPISNLPTASQPHSSILLTQNSSSASAPVAASAIKRKRPRPVNYNEPNPAGNNTNSFIPKGEIDQPPAKNGPPLSNSEITGSAVENSLPNSQFIQASLKSRQEALNAENRASSDSKPPLNEGLVGRDAVMLKEEDSNSPKKTRSAMLRFDGKCEDSTLNKANSMAHGNETKREEKFQIDLMAPPFQMRLSPEREGEVNFGIVESERKFETKDDVKTVPASKDDSRKDEPKEKVKSTMENTEPQRQTRNKERFLDMQLDLEKNGRDCSGSASFTGNKLSQNVVKQQQLLQQKNSRDEPSSTKKTVLPPGSLPLQMPMANWPGGLPPMGYMAPLHQGVVSMDGSSVSSATVKPPHCWPFDHPRTKRCATHGYIARAIHYSQRLPRTNPFLPTAASSASIYGSKPCNLNAMPLSEMHGNIQGRAMNSVHEKGHGVATFPGHVGKDKGSEASNIVDAAQRKQQIVFQQALQPGAPNDIMHGPAFIFPMSQQQPAPHAASFRSPGSLKSPATGASGTASSSTSLSAAATGVVPLAGPPMSFNYPNMAPANEAQYLAILQNSGYPFPIPAHVGGPPPAGYRGNHAQAMPFFNGSFYSPQMLHPSQAQPQQPPQSQTTPQISQGHQNPTISSGSSSSHKHLQNLHQRSHGGNAAGGSGANGGNGSMQGYSAAKTQPPQQLLNHQNQRLHLPQQLDSEAGGEDSPSTADSRVSRANMNVYAQNFAMPVHPQNFALMSHPASMNTVSGGSGNPSEKKQPPLQNQGMKMAGVDSVTSPAFAMSFASFNGVVANSPNLDISSMAHNHTILQNFPEAARHGYQQIMAPAQATHHQPKKGFRSSDEQKNGGGDSSSNGDEERKSMAGKIQGTGSQSIAFARADLSDTSGSTIPVNTVIDSSARSLGLGAGPTKTVGSNMPVANSHQQQQRQHQLSQQQQQQFQLQQQQFQLQQQQLQKQQSHYAGAATRNKLPATDNPPSSSAMSAKFTNSLPAFPQNLVQNSSSQSPQWKNPSRSSTPSQAPSPSIITSTTSSLKNLPHQQHQQGRAHQSHTQISFTNMPKSSPPSTSQAPSPPPPMVAGSPTNSSLSKGVTGSPRAGTVNSTGNKGGQVSTLSPQLGKSSPAAGPRKSSPVGGRTVPSILGNKPLLQQQPPPQQPLQHPNQFAKQGIQQAQIFFSNSYQQNQAFNPTMSGSTGSATSGFYTQRRRPEHHQQAPQSQSPVSLASAATSEPVKTAATAASPASSMKGGGGGLPQGNLESSANPHQLVSAGFSYAHAAPTAVQVKATEQKQPAGE